MTRSSQSAGEFVYDPEPKRIARRLKKLTEQAKASSFDSKEIVPTSPGLLEILDSHSDNSSSDLEEENMTNNRTLKQLTAPDLNLQP
ncbi:hypothetical protein PTKIN_Ptkin05aG0097400 [Pterospermum kingtungense]